MTQSRRIYWKATWLCLALASLAVPIAVATATPRETAAKIILTPLPGETAVDHEIANSQARIKAGRDVERDTIRLGWAFVAKARITSDPGNYKLAELCLDSLGGTKGSDGALLRGEIAHALHRFAEMEAIARPLIVSSPRQWQSFALLGDALMEQGKIGQAIEAYQSMIDLRPCLQTYARVAHLRWLKGDLDGALELMKLAVEESSTRDPEPAAWAYSRLATYQLQSGRVADANWSAKRATEFVADYPPALIVEAKICLVNGNSAAAVPLLRCAIAQSPLPEYQWLLADAARESGNEEFAARTEATIRGRGRVEDPRSFALFLATRHDDPNTALVVARQELGQRHDVLTYDALAWAALAAGDLELAKSSIKRAMAEGTSDARLFYHAGAIALANNDAATASSWFGKAAGIDQMLLPSERADLRQKNDDAKAQISDSSLSKTTNLASLGRK